MSRTLQLQGKQQAQHTARTAPRFVVLIQLCLWVDEILGETRNPLYFLSFFTKKSILQELIAMFYVYGRTQCTLSPFKPDSRELLDDIK